MLQHANIMQPGMAQAMALAQQNLCAAEVLVRMHSHSANIPTAGAKRQKRKL